MELLGTRAGCQALTVRLDRLHQPAVGQQGGGLAVEGPGQQARRPRLLLLLQRRQGGFGLRQRQIPVTCTWLHLRLDVHFMLATRAAVCTWWVRGRGVPPPSGTNLT